MYNPWTLPTSVVANGHEYKIRTDYRVVIELLTALSDPDMQGDSEAETEMIRAELVTGILFEDEIQRGDLEAALNAASAFIDMGIEEGNKNPIRLMDWEQDAQLIIPAVNKVIGREIRAERYMHWWTFLASYMEIGECSYSHILAIRQKRAKGKKLEKWEQEYINENKNVVLLKPKLTEEQKAEREEEKKAIDDLFG